MNRRRYLAAATSATAAVGAAGCIAGLGSSDAASGDTVTLDGVDFELGELRLQSTFVEQGEPFWNWDALAAPDAQYAVLPLRSRTDDEDRALDAIRNTSVAAEVDGDTKTSEHQVNEVDYDAVRVGVPIPDGESHDDAAVVIDGSVRYPLSSEHLDALADPPRYAIDVQIPETFEGMQIPVTLQVANDGGTPGTVAWTTTHSLVEDGWDTEQVTVPAGETQTSEFVHDRLDRNDGETVDVTVDYGYDEVEKTVRVE